MGQDRDGMPIQLKLPGCELLQSQALFVMQHHFGARKKAALKAIHEALGSAAMLRAISQNKKPCGKHFVSYCRIPECIVEDKQRFQLMSVCPLCEQHVKFVRMGERFVATETCPVGSRPCPPRKRLPTGVGYVYFLIDKSNNAIKIGYSARHPAGRVRTLQTGHPSELKLLGFIRGSEETETALHDRYKRLRIRGEWFRLSGQLKSYLKNNRLLLIMEK